MPVRTSTVRALQDDLGHTGVPSGCGSWLPATASTAGCHLVAQAAGQQGTTTASKLCLQQAPQRPARPAPCLPRRSLLVLQSAGLSPAPLWHSVMRSLTSLPLAAAAAVAAARAAHGIEAGQGRQGIKTASTTHTCRGEGRARGLLGVAGFVFL